MDLRRNALKLPLRTVSRENSRFAELEADLTQCVVRAAPSGRSSPVNRRASEVVVGADAAARSPVGRAGFLGGGSLCRYAALRFAF